MEALARINSLEALLAEAKYLLKEARPFVDSHCDLLSERENDLAESGVDVRIVEDAFAQVSKCIGVIARMDILLAEIKKALAE
jgi:hypothetical protein